VDTRGRLANHRQRLAQAAILPSEQRIAVVLHHILDLPVEAIATETGVPVGTVKARLARGRCITRCRRLDWSGREGGRGDSFRPGLT
jgi:RNA polymerase sigma-70 factor (ECF subfamily)